MKTFSRLLSAAALLLAACTIEENPARTSEPADSAAVRSAAEAITTDGLLSGIAALSHDSMEGRAPGTAGEEKTVAYLQAAFEAAGLRPGHPDGGWTQAVPLVGFSADPQATLTAGGQRIGLLLADQDPRQPSQHEDQDQAVQHAQLPIGEQQACDAGHQQQRR